MQMCSLSPSLFAVTNSSLSFTNFFFPTSYLSPTRTRTHARTHARTHTHTHIHTHTHLGEAANGGEVLAEIWVGVEGDVEDVGVAGVDAGQAQVELRADAGPQVPAATGELYRVRDTHQGHHVVARYGDEDGYSSRQVQRFSVFLFVFFY